MLDRGTQKPRSTFAGRGLHSTFLRDQRSGGFLFHRHFEKELAKAQTGLVKL